MLRRANKRVDTHNAVLTPRETHAPVQITAYLETEDITHLDFAVSLVKRRITAMHGMLG